MVSITTVHDTHTHTHTADSELTSQNVSQYSTVVLTVVRVMIAKYRKSGIWGYHSSLTPEPIELKLCMSDYVAHRTPHAPRGN